MNNNAYSLSPISGKKYKVYLVEIDDEDRERVLSGIAGSIEINHHNDVTSFYSDNSRFPIGSYSVPNGVELRMRMEPAPDGTYFKIENFSEDEDEED